MLTSMLPGFREIRAPFAAGALLLATAYVALFPYLDRATRSTRLSPGVAALGDKLGWRGAFALAAFSAYLLGSVYMSGRTSLTRELSTGLLHDVTRESYLDTDRRSPRLSVLAPFSRPSLRRIGVLRSEHHDVGLTRDICRDIIYGRGKRLLVANRDLFGEYDRLRAEAELRDAVVPPAILLAVVTAFGMDWALWTEVVLFVVAVLLGGALLLQARSLDREAHSIYAHAVADGLVSTATLDRLNRLDPSAPTSGPAPA